MPLVKARYRSRISPISATLTARNTQRTKPLPCRIASRVPTSAPSDVEHRHGQRRSPTAHGRWERRKLSAAALVARLTIFAAAEARRKSSPNSADEGEDHEAARPRTEEAVVEAEHRADGQRPAAALRPARTGAACSLPKSGLTMRIDDHRPPSAPAPAAAPPPSAATPPSPRRRRKIRRRWPPPATAISHGSAMRRA